jgi:uncharacterized repeat protein (TIGR01451 family)
MKKIALLFVLVLLSFAQSFAQAPRPFPAGLPTCLEDDFRELEKLYDATGGDNWTNKTGWFTEKDMSKWKGITLTSGSCDVEEISLNNNNLKGNLIDINLSKLYSITLNTNAISGTIPDFKNLPNLGSLDLRENQLTGSIPDFKNLPNLGGLDLTENRITGSIPDFTNLPNLRVLNLQRNQLTGTIPDFTNLPKLNWLYLNGNRLTGTIPDFINLPNLSILYLLSNQLTGSVPDFKNLPKLNWLNLTGNQLTGDIPNFKSTKITAFSINQNLFNFGQIEKSDLILKLKANTVFYAPQKTTLPILQNGNTFTGDLAGSTLNQLTYRWFRNNGELMATKTADNKYTFTKAGKYYYEVSHAVLTQDTLGQKLILNSQTFTIGAKLTGKLYADQNKNCKNDNEKGLKNNIIRFANPKDTVYVTSDALGNYEAALDTFNYAINVKINNLWTTCPSAKVKFNTWNDSTSLDIPLQPVVDCPSLEVHLSTQRLRRCFENTYNVAYCNKGAILAKNAYVEVDFDPFLEVLSATKPFTKISGNKYRFNIGTIEVMDCSNFDVKVKVKCDSTVVGQTHCSTAHIFPDSSCVISPSWDKSSLSINGKCQGEKVVFDIKNIGTSPTSQPTQYFVIEDQIVMLQSQPFNLSAGEIKNVSVNSTGKTYRIIAKQAANHPSGNASVSAVLEGCGGQNSLGFVTQFSDYDNESAIDVDCRVNIGAYDPNEKIPSPSGVGTQKLIEPNLDIEYQINFQNEGTDTAFMVIVRDTISKSLDVSTLRMGASSAPYTWNLSGQGNLQVMFDKINLTTKKQDEVKSQGFVKFRISQKHNLPIGTLIENRAGIYFDFNSVVLTNKTQHRIGKELFVTAIPEVSENQNLKVLVYPNPFRTSATFKIESDNDEQFTLQIIDLQGKTIHRQTFEEKQLTLEKTLFSGMYFYQIKGNKGSVSNGKLIVQ